MYVFLTWFDSYEQQSIYFALFLFLFKKDFSLLNVFFFSLYYTYVFFFLTAAAAYAWWSWRRLPRARPRLVAAARLDRSIAWTS